MWARWRGWLRRRWVVARKPLIRAQKPRALVRIWWACLIWNFADGVGFAWVFAPLLVIVVASIRRAVEVGLDVRKLHVSILNRWARAPTWIAVAPVTQRETSRVKWYTAGRFPEELAVGVERHAFRGPVEAIFVIAVCGAETDGRRTKEVVLWDLRTGVDDEEEGSGFSGILIQLGE